MYVTDVEFYWTSSRTSRIEWVSKWKLEKYGGSMWAWYPRKYYSVPARLVLIAEPRAFENVTETEICTRNLGKGLHAKTDEIRELIPGRRWCLPAYSGTLKTGFYIVRVNPDRRSIELAIPRYPVDPDRVHWSLVIIRRDGYRSTNATKHYPIKIVPEDAVVYADGGASFSGMHGERLWVVMLDRRQDEKFVVYEWHVSGRGNIHVYKITVDINGRGEFSEITDEEEGRMIIEERRREILRYAARLLEERLRGKK